MSDNNKKEEEPTLLEMITKNNGTLKVILNEMKEINKFVKELIVEKKAKKKE